MTLRKLCDVLDRACTRLTPAQKRYKADFEKMVSLGPIIEFRDYFYVYRPFCPFKSTERSPPGVSTEEGAPAVNLLPKAEGSFCLKAGTSTTVFVDQYGVSNRVSIDRVTRMPGGTWRRYSRRVDNHPQKEGNPRTDR